MNKKETLEAAARGEGCLGRSQDDEPVFVIVARDVTAAETVRAWAGAYVNAAITGGVTTLADGCPFVAKARDAIGIAAEMDAWREAHGGGKVPD